MLIYAGGLGLQGYAMSRVRNSVNISEAGGLWFYESAVRPVWVIWIIPLVILFFGTARAYSYYDFLLSMTNQSLIIGLWALAFLVYMWLQFIRNPALTDKLVLTFMTVVIVGPFFFNIPNSSRMFVAVLQKPQFGTGILNEIRAGGDAKSPVRYYYLLVDNEKLVTPDGGWCCQYSVGDEIDYAFSSSVNYIFSPNKTKLTWHGVINLMNGILIWSVMTFLMVDGWTNFGNIIRDIQYSRKPSVGKH